MPGFFSIVSPLSGFYFSRSHLEERSWFCGEVAGCALQVGERRWHCGHSHSAVLEMEGTVSRCGRPAAWLHSGATFRDCFDSCSDQLVSLSDIWESTHTHIYIYIYLRFFLIYIYMYYLWYTYIYIISILYVNNICTFKYIISIFSIFIWYKFIIDIVYTYYIYNYV